MTNACSFITTLFSQCVQVHLQRLELLSVMPQSRNEWKTKSYGDSLSGAQEDYQASAH